MRLGSPEFAEKPPLTNSYMAETKWNDMWHHPVSEIVHNSRSVYKELQVSTDSLFDGQLLMSVNGIQESLTPSYLIPMLKMGGWTRSDIFTVYPALW